MTSRPIMTREEVEAFLDREFPQMHAGGRVFSIDEVGPLWARTRMLCDDRHIRPGGTVSGPTLMTFADLAFYATILANVGPLGLTVTTSLTFNFMRKAEPGPLLAECRLFKLGKRLVVGEASIFTDGSPDLICHATGTYSVPNH